MGFAPNGVFEVKQFNNVVEIYCHGNENLGILTQNWIKSANTRDRDKDVAPNRRL